MVPIPFHSLPINSDGFLKTPDIRMIGHGVTVRGQFDLEAFDPSLFAKLGITQPASLSKAAPKRLAEFLAGRTMARIAQEVLGHRATAIKIGENRAPVWPDHLRGSISHARGHCACFAQAASYGDVGIDVDLVAQNQALKAILRMVAGSSEREVMATSTLPLNLCATLLFSAKETLFKTLYPVVQRHFGFPCAALRMPPADGIIRLFLTEALHASLPVGTFFDIAYDCDGDHVCTWLVHSPT